MKYCDECGFAPIVVPQHARRCAAYSPAMDLEIAELAIAKAHVALHGTEPTPEFRRTAALQMIAEQTLEAAQ